MSLLTEDNKKILKTKCITWVENEFQEYIQPWVKKYGNAIAKNENGSTLLLEFMSEIELGSDWEFSVYLILKLIDLGVDCNAKDKNGWTALHYLYYQKYIWIDYSVLKALINKGKADINATNNYGNTPLYYADIYGESDIESLGFILRATKDLNHQNINGTTALLYHWLGNAYEDPIVYNLLELALDDEVDPTIPDKDGFIIEDNDYREEGDEVIDFSQDRDSTIIYIMNKIKDNYYAIELEDYVSLDQLKKDFPDTTFYR
jgi:hypothetical protein